MKAVIRFDELGVIHFDINENNIMFTPPEAPERAVILDFGYACLRPEGASDEEWANSLKGDPSHLRISLEKRLGTKLDGLDEN